MARFDHLITNSQLILPIFPFATSFGTPIAILNSQSVTHWLVTHVHMTANHKRGRNREEAELGPEQPQEKAMSYDTGLVTGTD